MIGEPEYTIMHSVNKGDHFVPRDEAVKADASRWLAGIAGIVLALGVICAVCLLAMK